MKCSDCSKEINENAQYCRFCGKKQFLVSETVSVQSKINNISNVIPIKSYKKYFYILLVIILLGIFYFLGSASKENNGSRIYDSISPSVVSIRAIDEKGNQFAHASGVVISNDGKILTNYHVIESAHQLKISTADGSVNDVDSIVAADKDTDYAILKVNSIKLSAIPIADSSEPKIGDKIYTISSPSSEALKNSFASGEMSGIRQRELLSSDQNMSKILGKKLIQFTAPVSHGSSGGALLDKNGKLIGLIVALINEGENLNFAIPINEIKSSFDSISSIPFSVFAQINDKKSSEDNADTSSANNKPLEEKYSFNDLLEGGNIAFREGKYQTSIILWEAARKQKPTNLFVLNKIAFAYQTLKDFDNALVYYLAALKITENDPMTNLNAAEIIDDMLRSKHGKCALNPKDCKDSALGIYIALIRSNAPEKIKKEATDRYLALSSYVIP